MISAGLPNSPLFPDPEPEEEPEPNRAEPVLELEPNRDEDCGAFSVEEVVAVT